MKLLRWIIGTVILAVILAVIILRPLPFLFSPDLPFTGMFGRGLYIIILTCFLCLYRVMRGPTGADRIARPARP